MNRINRFIYTFIMAVCLLYVPAVLQAANIVSTLPVANSNYVAVNANISVTFDAAIAGASATAATFRVTGAGTGIIAGTFTGGGTNTITFNPASDFKAGELITVTLTTGIGLPASYTWQFTVAAQPGPLNFTSNIVTVTTAADSPHSIYPIDMDGDGDVDIVSAAYGIGTITWEENTGSEVFTHHTLATGLPEAYWVHAADMDNDGDIDVLSASRANSQISWHENDGSENFTLHVITTAAMGAVVVHTADVDGDGDMDVLSASWVDSKVAWYENNAGVFTEHVITTTATSVYSVYTADVDRDGDVDVLSASNADNTFAWYENDGAQVFTRHVITNAANVAYNVFAGDLDDDGDLDVLGTSAGDDEVLWYENDGAQVFAEHVISNNADAGRRVRMADMDGDGDMDLLTASGLDNKIAWYENDGSQVFTVHVIATDAMSAQDVCAVDMDGDGDLDILTASIADDKILWYRNGAAGTGGPGNVAPSFIKGADIQVNEDAPQQTVTAWATSISAGPAGEAGQTLSFVVTNTNNALFTTQPAISATGTLVFLPAPNAFGSATVTVVLTDNGGGNNESTPATFVINVLPVNDAPLVNPVADQLATAGVNLQFTLTGLHPGPFEDDQTLSIDLVSDASPLNGFAVVINGDGTATVTLRARPTSLGEIAVTLAIRDNGGTDRGGDDETLISFVITVRENDAVSQSIFLPTLFSPNGDGANDVFRVRGEGIADIRFSVYSADGHEVFRTTDITEASERGWNGSYHGREMPAGTYTWTLEGHFADGTVVKFENKAFGQVVLLR